MTIIEAINSGKPYKRKGDTNWFPPDTTQFWITTDEIIANDWEVKEETRELTWAEVLTGVGKHIQATPSEWDKIKKELGFDGD